MPEREQRSDFSFVHISDLHFQSENISEEVFRAEILNKMQELQINPNCLIISGDIFHKGFLTSDSAERTIRFIESLRTPDISCFAVPGNHDLNRAACQKADGAYNEYLTRRRIVRKKAQELLGEHKEFNLNAAEKKVLYSETFDDFFKFLSNAGFSPFGENSQDIEKKQLKCTATNYEVGVKYFTLQNKYKIRIVLINTALIAGQSIYESEYNSTLASLKREATKDLEQGRTEEALKKIDTLLRNQAQFKETGELIVDEDPLPGKNMGGRMSLSRDGLLRLSEIGMKKNDTNCMEENDANCILTIFVGHHEIDYLSTATKKALFTAMKHCNSHIYLCGHAHKAGHTIQVQQGTQIVNQFRSGGLFLDKTKYGQCSFNYGSLLVRGTPDVPVKDRQGTTQVEFVLRIRTYFQIETPSKKLVWYCEEPEETIRLNNVFEPHNKNASKGLSTKGSSDPEPIKNTSARPAETGNVFKKNQRSVV